MTTTPRYALNDGNSLPQIGFGTYPLRGSAGVDTMVAAIAAGYRLIDSATNYQNESEVGDALRRAPVPRAAVAVTTKVPGRFHRKDLAIRSVENSLRAMNLVRLDLVLIHWPNPSTDLYLDAWEGLIECRERDLVRSIGVSNFTEEHLERIIAATGVTPAVNQIELHPRFPQADLRQVHQRLGILTESWSPLGGDASAIGAQAVRAAAQAHGVTGAQVILRWHLQLGALPLPKTATPARQLENLDVFGFTLTESEMDQISALGRPDGRIFGADPNTHEEM